MGNITAFISTYWNRDNQTYLGICWKVGMINCTNGNLVVKLNAWYKTFSKEIGFEMYLHGVSAF